MSGFDTKLGRELAATSDVRADNIAHRKALLDACDEVDRLRDTLTATENALRRLDIIDLYDGSKLRHWLGSQDVLDVSCEVAQAVAIVHAAMHVRAAARVVVSADREEGAKT